VPEQVKPATLDQVLPGKTHDLTYFFSMSWLEAMDSAMFANGFLFKRATDPTLKSIEKKLTTFTTYRILM
jgi:hypothetical protein